MRAGLKFASGLEIDRGLIIRHTIADVNQSIGVGGTRSSSAGAGLFIPADDVDNTTVHPRGRMRPLSRAIFFEKLSPFFSRLASSMRCPFCHQDNDKVTDSRAADDGYMHRRKRMCQGCNRRFTTLEQIEELNVRVAKNNKNREPFDREKIRRGIERACSKRGVGSDAIEATVQAIEIDIYTEFELEIPARLIGEIVLRHLARLDEIAYIRFASVYREFDSADAFIEIIDQLKSVATTKPRSRKRQRSNDSDGPCDPGDAGPSTHERTRAKSPAS